MEAERSDQDGRPLPELGPDMLADIAAAAGKEELPTLLLHRPVALRWQSGGSPGSGGHAPGMHHEPARLCRPSHALPFEGGLGLRPWCAGCTGFVGFLGAAALPIRVLWVLAATMLALQPHPRVCLQAWCGCGLHATTPPSCRCWPRQATSAACSPCCAKARCPGPPAAAAAAAVAATAAARQAARAAGRACPPLTQATRQPPAPRPQQPRTGPAPPPRPPPAAAP